MELCQSHEPLPATLHTTNLEAAASLNPPLNLCLNGSLFHGLEENLLDDKEKNRVTALLAQAVVEPAASPLGMRRHIAIRTTFSVRNLREHDQQVVSKIPDL